MSKIELFNFGYPIIDDPADRERGRAFDDLVETFGITSNAEKAKAWAQIEFFSAGVELAMQNYQAKKFSSPLETAR